MVDWWSDVELWLSGIPFPFQFALVIGVLAPLGLVVAWLIDRVVDHASALLGTSRDEEPPLGGPELREGVEEEPAELVSAAKSSE
jgi:hypothetical protein